MATAIKLNIFEKCAIPANLNISLDEFIFKVEARREAIRKVGIEIICAIAFERDKSVVLVKNKSIIH